MGAVFHPKLLRAVLVLFRWPSPTGPVASYKEVSDGREYRDSVVYVSRCVMGFCLVTPHLTHLISPSSLVSFPCAHSKVDVCSRPFHYREPVSFSHSSHYPLSPSRLRERSWIEAGAWINRTLRVVVGGGRIPQHRQGCNLNTGMRGYLVEEIDLIKPPWLQLPCRHVETMTELLLQHRCNRKRL